jgi:hypothetical protein
MISAKTQGIFYLNGSYYIFHHAHLNFCMKIKIHALLSFVVTIFAIGCLPTKRAYFPDSPSTYSVKADWPGLRPETKTQLETLSIQGQKNTLSICASGKCMVMGLPKPLPPCNPPGICLTLFEMTYKDRALVTLTNKTDNSIIQLTVKQSNSSVEKVLNALQNHTLILQAQ